MNIAGEFKLGLWLSEGEITKFTSGQLPVSGFSAIPSALCWRASQTHQGQQLLCVQGARGATPSNRLRQQVTRVGMGAP